MLVLSCTTMVVMGIGVAMQHVGVCIRALLYTTIGNDGQLAAGAWQTNPLMSSMYSAILKSHRFVQMGPRLWCDRSGSADWGRTRSPVQTGLMKERVCRFAAHS